MQLQADRLRRQAVRRFDGRERSTTSRWSTSPAARTCRRSASSSGSGGAAPAATRRRAWIAILDNHDRCRANRHGRPRRVRRHGRRRDGRWRSGLTAGRSECGGIGGRAGCAAWPGDGDGRSRHADAAMAAAAAASGAAAKPMMADGRAPVPMTAMQKAGWPASRSLVTPTVRTHFADTAFWVGVAQHRRERHGRRSTRHAGKPDRPGRSRSGGWDTARASAQAKPKSSRART